jgi:hypothetical protein
VLARRGANERPEFVVMREHSDDAGDCSGHVAMKKLLDLNPRPDGGFLL